MQASISLGRITGIPVGLHYSWLIIATLITLSLASHFGATNSDWPVTIVWVSAVVTALLFFATLVAHELLACDCCQIARPACAIDHALRAWWDRAHGEGRWLGEDGILDGYCGPSCGGYTGTSTAPHETPLTLGRS